MVIIFYNLLNFLFREVLRQEKDANRPYFAHIFKYNLAGKFPVLGVDLKFFCLKVNDFNLEMVILI